MWNLEIPKFDIDTVIGLVWFVHSGEIEIDRHVLGDLARIGEQFAQRREDVMIRAIVVELDLSHELESYALMVDLGARLLETYVHSACHVLAIVVDELFDFFAVLEHFHRLARLFRGPFLTATTTAWFVKLEFDVTTRTETE